MPIHIDCGRFCWTGPSSDGLRRATRVLRGGSWYNTNPDNFRAANLNNNNLTNRNNNNSFRCVWRSPGPSSLKISGVAGISYTTVDESVLRGVHAHRGPVLGRSWGRIQNRPAATGRRASVRRPSPGIYKTRPVGGPGARGGRWRITARGFGFRRGSARRYTSGFECRPSRQWYSRSSAGRRLRRTAGCRDDAGQDAESIKGFDLFI